MIMDAPEDERLQIHLMFIEENRLKSFKDWVFDNCACTPEKVSFLKLSGIMDSTRHGIVTMMDSFRIVSKGVNTAVAIKFGHRKRGSGTRTYVHRIFSGWDGNGNRSLNS
jgi:hypothetical protein